jgi:hypothetical protein
MLNEFVIHLINTWGNDFLLPWAMFLNLVYTTLQNMKEKKALLNEMTVFLNMGEECFNSVCIMEKVCPRRVCTK